MAHNQFFFRDASRRDLGKSMLDFLNPQRTCPEQAPFEENQYLLFKTLGQDFSLHAYANPHLLGPDLKEIVLGKIENECHNTAHHLLEIFKDQVALVWGFIDWYDIKNNRPVYGGTFSHSFVIERDTRAIIDPIFLKFLLGKCKRPGFTHNHFGIIIPEEIILDLIIDNLVANINSKNNFCGCIYERILSDRQKTELFITNLQKISSYSSLLPLC